MKTSTSIRLLCMIAVLSLLTACAKPSQPPLPLGNVKLGIAPYTQPLDTAHMLAGYIPQGVQPVDQEILSQLDSLLASTLHRETKHVYVERDAANICLRQVAQQNQRQSALRTWSAVGRCMNVDLLIVPQIFEYRERDGGNYGVSRPARIVMDTYIIDVRSESLVSRSRFDETQSSLSSNLLEADKFFKRGGKWIPANELAQEGMMKAIKELGL